MSTKQLEHVRDLSLAARVKRALGGIPTLQLTLREPAPTEAYQARFDREASLRALRAIFGESR